MYNETNYTALFTDPLIQFNSSREISMQVVNGTGILQSGYMSSFCRVEGMDLLLQLFIVIAVFLAVILIELTMYVGLYLWRYVTND